MPRRRTAFSPDRRALLVRSQEELEEELRNVAREEEYLGRQIQRAREQLHYYEQLLSEFRQSLGRGAPLHEFARRLG